MFFDKILIKKRRKLMTRKKLYEELSIEFCKFLTPDVVMASNVEQGAEEVLGDRGPWPW